MIINNQRISLGELELGGAGALAPRDILTPEKDPVKIQHCQQAKIFVNQLYLAAPLYLDPDLPH